MFPVHGKRGTPEYVSWLRMKSRCYYKKCDSFHRYGGRGVTVCDRWKNSFLAFLEDMGQKPTPQHQIDRINGAGNYCPENCRWSTPKENASHRCTARLITVNGITKSLQQWSDETGIDKGTLHYRWKKNWLDSRFLSVPGACV